MPGRPHATGGSCDRCSVCYVCVCVCEAELKKGDVIRRDACAEQIVQLHGSERSTVRLYVTTPLSDCSRPAGVDTTTVTDTQQEARGRVRRWTESLDQTMHPKGGGESLY